MMDFIIEHGLDIFTTILGIVYLMLEYRASIALWVVGIIMPALDAFTNALSFVGLWALARKYVEQWAFWIVVDVICCYLYIVKGIPFKAGLYGLYVVIAVMGYFKWKAMVATTNGSKQ